MEEKFGTQNQKFLTVSQLQQTTTVTNIIVKLVSQDLTVSSGTKCVYEFLVGDETGAVPLIVSGKLFKKEIFKIGSTISLVDVQCQFIVDSPTLILTQFTKIQQSEKQLKSVQTSLL
ncbi:hypothetical protein M0813_22218 [Anaeramoeba flamelloides]|uniref:Uncharacterized protein n=1 Tax=Anaeramoeba flamelloides TaxID=1746091 RepID=A0AAV8A297_9EUKA|nr:hypothetical protein M0812_00766 [Anaeramoeba flamelloides]KAJ6243777.1 hypothetical protein M0813_22218 [Anaeramoeba flamelloides]